MRLRPATRREKFASGLAIALIPLSLWGFYLASKGIPRRIIEDLLGPGEQRPHTSAPPYLEWDIACMLLMLAICGASALCLVAKFVQRWRTRGGHARKA